MHVLCELCTVYVPPCFLQQSPSLSFFASHPSSYVNFFSFFFLFQPIAQLFSLRSSTHRFENTVSKIPDFRGKSTIIFITPPSWKVYRYLLLQKTNFFPLDSISNLHNPCRLPNGDLISTSYHDHHGQFSWLSANLSSSNFSFFFRSLFFSRRFNVFSCRLYGLVV